MSKDESRRREDEEETKTKTKREEMTRRRRKRVEKRWFRLRSGARTSRRPSGRIRACASFFASISGRRFFLNCLGYRLPFWYICDVLWCFLHNFFEHGFHIEFALDVHGFWDRFVIDFSSFLHTDIAPLPKLVRPIFEQQYGVLRSKSSFDPFRKT